MTYNFDEITDRRHSNSYKWGSAVENDVLPLWVADMDFKAAPPILDALAQRVQHGVFGYTKVPDAYYNAVISWFERRHQFSVKRDEILFTTGVVPALSAIILAHTEPGDKVLVQEPVYNCFFSSIRNNRCEIVSNNLLYSEGNYTIDWEDLEQKAADPKTKMLLLCNPHNPVGRAWSRAELERIGQICLNNGVLVVSDEIHCDLVYPEHKHISFAFIGEKYRNNLVICTSPSKAFNLAGLQVANMFVFNQDIRKKIDKALNINEVCEINPFAVEALIAAYSHPESEAWLENLKMYLWDNYKHVRDFFQTNLPQFPVIKLQATYLLWIDCSVVNMPSKEIAKLVLTNEKLWINEGTIYGAAGEGFIRINMACPKSVLQEGLTRLKRQLDQLQAAN